MRRTVIPMGVGVALLCVLQVISPDARAFAQQTDSAGWSEATAKIVSAKQLMDARRLQPALEAAQEALRLYEALEGTVPRALEGIANSRTLIGRILDLAGEHARAVEILRESVENHRAAAPDSNNLAVAMEYLGLAYANSDKVSEAVNTYGSAASVYRNIGRLDLALECISNSLILADRMPKTAEWMYTAAVLRHNRAGIQVAGKHHNEAVQDYQKALEILEQLSGTKVDDLLVSALERKANSLLELGRGEEALAELQRELEFTSSRTSTKTALATVHSNIALVEWKLGKTGEAYESCRRALALLVEVEGTEGQQIEVMERAAGILVEAKQDAPVLDVYLSTAKLYVRIQGTPKYDKDRHALCLGKIAEHLSRNGRRSEAIDYYRQAMALAKDRAGSGETYSVMEWNLTKDLIDSGQPAGGIAALSRAMSGLWNVRSSRILQMGEEDRGELVRDVHTQADFIYRQAFASPETGGAAGFEAALIAKSLATELGRAEFGAWLDELQGAHGEKIERLRELYGQVSRRVLLQVGEYGEEFDPDRKELTSKAEEIAAIEDFLRSKIREGRGLPMPDLSRVQAALRPGESVLEFVRWSQKSEGGQRYGVFVLSGGGGKPIAIDLGAAADVDAAIIRYLDSMRDQTDPTGYRLDEDALAAQGEKLRRLILDPITSRIPKPKGTGRIYVVPAGTIGFVPFEALPTGRDGSQWRYVVEDYQVEYLLTARDLQRYRRPAASGSEEVWVVADPDFSAGPEQRLGSATAAAQKPKRAVYEDAIGDFDRIAATGEFARTVEESVRASGMRPKLLTDVAASEENVSTLRSPAALIFATHGYFMNAVAPMSSLTWKSVGGKGQFGADFRASMNPLMRSMLVLAGANRRYHRYTVGGAAGSPTGGKAAPDAGHELSDGFLTAYEVTKLDLRATKMVVLLGCETGAGVLQTSQWTAERMTAGAGFGMEMNSANVGKMAMALPTSGDEAAGGLRQAFLIAGAHAVVASLWRVPNAESQALIADFMDEWLTRQKGRRAFASFHAAQLRALRRAREKGSAHPVAWSGFVYLGEPDDLDAMRP